MQILKQRSRTSRLSQLVSEKCEDRQITVNYEIKTLDSGRLESTN